MEARAAVVGSNPENPSQRRLSEEMMMLQSAISRDLSSQPILPRDISVLTTISSVKNGPQESNNTHNNDQNNKRASYLAEDEDYTDFATN